MGHAKPFGEGHREQRSLVVAAFSFSLPVERHGDNDVCGQYLRFAFCHLGEAFGKPLSQRLDLLKLQQHNCLNQRAFVNREATRSVKCIRFVLANGTNQGAALVSRQAGKRPSAELAAGLGNSLKGRKAVIANGNAARVDKQLAANPAIPGKEDAEQRIAGSPCPRTHTPPSIPRDPAGGDCFCHAGTTVLPLS